MKYILSILITLFAVQAIAQPTPTYTGSYTQMSYNRGSVGALRLQYIPRGFYPFPTFDTLGTIWVDSAMTRGLFYHNGALRLRLASVPYVDSVAASIEAGSVDSSIYSTVTRLADSLHNLRDYVDSNNTIIYGAISALYDTLPNYIDTAMFNDSLALKQNYSDTTTFDATRYYVDTGNAAIRAGYVPYTGATTDVDLGTHSISARTGVINKTSGTGIALSVTKGGNGEALTVNKTSGIGNAMSVTGGVTLLETLHTTNPIADAYIASAATWNGKMNYSDTVGLSNRIDLKLNITDTANIRLRPIAGSNMTITGTYPNLTFNATSNVTDTSFNTFTNKRMTYRTTTAASYTTSVTIASDSVDMFVVTAQAGALLFNAPSGTPTQGQMLLIRIKDNGTARALTWNGIFRSGDVILPTTTTINKTLYMEFLYNSTDTKWDIVGKSDNY